MVAYSFKAQFVEPIATLAKRQAVRGERKRHARVGEPAQLYAAMRTRYCWKILTPDPICVEVQPVRIHLNSRAPELIESIHIDGHRLSDDEIEAFAVADGFGGALAEGFARRRMGEFWLKEHDWNGFIGLLIRWEPQA